MNKDKIIANIVLILFLAIITCSCSNENVITSIHIAANSDSVCYDIINWNITGTFTKNEDPVLYSTSMHFPDFSSSYKQEKSSKKLWHQGPYTPKYGQLDLKEVFNISVTDTAKVLDSLITYLSCNITSETTRNLFLYVRTEMTTSPYINGDSLHSLDITDMEIYPIHIKAGMNSLIIRTQGAKRGYWYEATLYDSTSIARLYAEEHTGNIVFPIIKNDSVILTDHHSRITDKPIKLQFHDVNGKKIADQTLTKNTPPTFHLKGLENNRAYICSMIMAGITVKQPVMSGCIENIEPKYRALRDSLPDNHPRADEIDQLIYRIWKLNMTTGKMREEHWFYFKFPWVAYQLEHIFAHLNGTYGNDESENNFKFITYQSKLDGCLQRYFLISPNKIDRKKKYPLIVVMRPCNENRYHLFFCPQIAHQFVVNNMQAVANKYDTFIIMPEARMMLNEDMMPFADAEMKLAIKDVQEHYSIDNSRIYLHANCSGGYRALRFATYNPDIFAAIALYAPVYRCADDNHSSCSPETMLKNIKDVPTLIFGDPADTHSPTKVYADLVKDCEKYGVPFELTLRRNSGQGYHGYHRLVVGRDACEFFKDKRKEKKAHNYYSFPPRDTTVADFYSKPFIYVYNASDTSSVYKKLVRDIQNEYEDYLYARLPFEKQTIVPRMPLIPDTRVTKNMLVEKNVFLIGTQFTCQHVKTFAEMVKRNVMEEGRNINGIMLVSSQNPINKELMTVLYTSSKGNAFEHKINYPWRNGFSSILTCKFKNETFRQIK